MAGGSHPEQTRSVLAKRRGYEDVNSAAEARKRFVVLVTDGEQRAALAVVRSLGAAGHSVIVTSTRSRSLAGASRFARRHITLPSALGDPAGFLEALAAVVRSCGVEVLLPITEESLISVLGSRERFPGVLIPFATLSEAGLHTIIYPNGDETHCFAVCFLAESWRGEPRPDGVETTKIELADPASPPSPIHGPDRPCP